ncbi:hypothetical protein OEZ86_003735 [Tetradesmus obliquus]|nr:hypothetical protein OEZ86_003735 [Tetradesmus obliquus]
MQLPGANAQSIYRGILPAVFNNFSCSTKATNVLDKTLTVSPANICKDFGMGSPNVLTCTGLDLLDDLTKRVTGDCTPHKQAPIASKSATGEPIPQPLPDRRPLPPGAFDDTDALLAAEGGTHYWYITNVINLFLWAPCQGAAGFATPLVMPEGWRLLHMESTPPQGPYKIAIPMYAVLKSGDGKQLAVVIRGTRTAVEWQVDMTYVQTKDASYPGLVSKGFSFGAALLWPALESILLKEVVQGGVTDVTISGHSLGAALATLLAYRAQVLLDDKLAAAGKPLVAVGALLFAPPNVGSDAFVADFNKRVNARRIAFQWDIIPQVPCAPRMMACQGSIFTTALPGISSWNYAPVGGDITLTAAGMPVQPQAWQKLETINGCRILPWAIATHVCSYPCFYSKSAAAGAPEYGRCKLWGQSKGKLDASFCSGYPYHEPEYPSKGMGSKVVVGNKPHDNSKPFELIIGGK